SGVRILPGTPFRQRSHGRGRMRTPEGEFDTSEHAPLLSGSAVEIRIYQQGVSRCPAGNPHRHSTRTLTTSDGCPLPPLHSLLRPSDPRQSRCRADAERTSACFIIRSDFRWQDQLAPFRESRATPRYYRTVWYIAQQERLRARIGLAG